MKIMIIENDLELIKKYDQLKIDRIFLDLEILGKKDYKKHFGGKFESFGELKTAPRNFDKDHPAIDLIRKKQYIFTKKYTDREVHSDTFLEDVNKSFKAVRPFFNYMSEVLTTDANGTPIE